MAANDRGESLNRRQRRFVAALVGSPTIEGAAKEAGISPRTAYRYLADPAVKAELAGLLDGQLAQVTRLTVRGMVAALGTLSVIHRDPGAPAGARVSAARTIMESGSRLRESEELAERLAVLEQLLTGGDDE